MWVVTKKCSNGSVVWRLVDTDRQTNKQNIYSENLQKTIGRRHYSNTYLMLNGSVYTAQLWYLM